MKPGGFRPKEGEPSEPRGQGEIAQGMQRDHGGTQKDPLGNLRDPREPEVTLGLKEGSLKDLRGGEPSELKRLRHGTPKDLREET